MVWQTYIYLYLYKVYGRICIGHMQILCYLYKGFERLWILVPTGVLEPIPCRLRDDCIYFIYIQFSSLLNAV